MIRFHLIVQTSLVTMMVASSVHAVDFERDIQHVLNTHCAGCHGGVKKSGGFSVIGRDLLLAAADSGQPAVVPGNADGSELMRRILSSDESEQMPPAGEDRLQAHEIQALRDWINDGVKWPEHWAWQPFSDVPSTAEFGDQHPIDWYVRRKLDSVGVEPSPRADRTTLLRRLSLDLTGLLPDPADIQTLDDAETWQVGEAADRLLASPHFGERWARHWLDEARYADSEGFEKDSAKEDAWLFRDWVVNAYNNDMPFDDFTRRQLAGDLLPEPTAEDLIATKFQLQTQFNLEGGVDSEEDRTRRVVDQVGTIGSVWMAMSIGCCQCHDHPYDPLRHSDFYGLYAFLNNTDLAADFLAGEPKDAAKIRDERNQKWQKLVSLLDRQISDKNLSDDCQRDLSGLRGYDNSKGFVRYLTERSADRRRTTYVFERGDFLRPMTDAGEVFPGVPIPLGRIESDKPQPDRLDLANWLVTSAAPLTARVEVNKIWMHLFGQALADQPQEFGSRGTAPTHPQLLDFLARWFVEEAKWSRKQLIRLIVTSDTWQQSAALRPELVRRDPNNQWLARQNRFRVEAEILRDISLQASGLLSDKVGGKSVFPPIPEIVTQQTYAGQNKYKASTGEDRYRRGLYTFFRRTAIDPNLSTFDCPDSSLTKAQRDRSNNALQALATLHNEVFHEAAQAFANRILKADVQTDAERLQFAYVAALGRTPDETETAALQQLLDESRTHYSQDLEAAKAVVGDHAAEVEPPQNAAWVMVARVILNLDEFVTRG
ncbi:MAG: PSD1 domain-containing protein [Planctomycetaceae bacterium]|nr:PSD1 domain-containing protein [Planctomycetaceae bacterium]